MRQHILRLFIVLVLVVGIGAIIYFAVKDNAPFIIEDYVSSEIKKDEDLKENLSTLNSKVNATFNESVVIYGIYEDSLKFNTGLLVNVEFSKSEASEIKSIFNNYRQKVDDLITSTNSLINYLDISDQNQNELAGRKEKVNADFKELNKNYYNINVYLENVVSEKIYNETNLNALASLKSCLNIIADCYNETKANFSFLTNVKTKIASFELNSKNVSKETVKFAVKFNEMGRNKIKTDFNEFFVHMTQSSDLTVLLSLLNSEAYYEEV